MYSPELTNQISIWRQKAMDGSLTLDEMREAIRLMRAGRLSAIEAQRVSKRARPAPKSAEELLGEISQL